MSQYSNLEQVRLDKVERLREQGIEPYPTQAERTHTSLEAIAAFKAAEAAGEPESVTATLVGRLRSMRPMGKITFAHVEDGHGRIQLFLRADDFGKENLEAFNREFDLGDFVQAGGEMFRTRTGEVTLRVRELHMLAKAITPLPAAKDEVVNGEVVRHQTLSDPEARYRQRYADLAINPEVRHIFRTRTAIVRALQEFLDSAWFPGGRDAHPAAAVRRRSRAPLYHPPQPAQARPLPAHLLRAVPETAVGGRP